MDTAGWPWLTGRPAAQPPQRALTGLTAASGIGLLAAAAVQGAEAILAALTITWLHRSPAPRPAGPQRNS